MFLGKICPNTVEHKRYRGMSGVLTYTVDAIKRWAEALKEEIRDSVKVIVGDISLKSHAVLSGQMRIPMMPFGVKLCLQWMKSAKQGEE